MDKRTLQRTYQTDGQPISEPGSTLQVIPDGSDEFARLYEAAGKENIRRREG